MICVSVICSWCLDCRQLENITPEIVDALNDVWDKQLSMLDWDGVSAEYIKSPCLSCVHILCVNTWLV